MAKKICKTCGGTERQDTDNGNLPGIPCRSCSTKRKLSDAQVMKLECKSEETCSNDCEFYNGVKGFCLLTASPNRWDLRKIKPATLRARKKHGV